MANDVIPIFGRDKREIIPVPISPTIGKIENIRSRISGLYDQLEEISAEISKLDGDELDDACNISQERALGYIDALLDQVDSAELMFAFVNDEEEAG